MNPLRVKICGITRAADAVAAAAAGADAVGFNLWPGSPRCIDLAAAAAWIAELPSFLLRVAVMVDPDPAEVVRVAALPFIDRLQFHGRESPAFCAACAGRGIPFIKAVRPRTPADLGALPTFSTRDLLLDAFVPGVPGGTGRTADWTLAAAAVATHPELRLVLAGGLNPDNVGAAVAAVRPYGVDVAGGVETGPGAKDAGKIRAFIAAARG